MTMPKHLHANVFRNLADYSFDRWFGVMPPDVTFEDLFHPTTWAHYANKFKKFDVVRAVAEDGSYDVDLTVSEVTVGGIHMRVRPFFKDAAGDAAVAVAAKAASSAAPKIGPLAADGKSKIRVEFLPATKWRVLGLNGEVSRDHATEAAANKAMAKYLKDIGMELPADAPAPEVKSKKDAA